MKALVILSVVQTACILFLLFKVVGGEPSTDPRMDTQFPARDRVQAGNPGGFESAPARSPLIDETRLRQIIQEELAYYLDAAPQSARQADDDRAPPRDPMADRNQRAIVDRQIAQLIGIGTVAPEELHDLFGEIAKLHPEDRSEALRRLTRAMNTGQIKGHL